MEMATIGATEKGGVCRLALTDLDREARERFVAWCEAARCQVSVDRMGSIFARRPGRDDKLPPVLTGSHLDTQPTGGKFDGAYGVLAGLEVLRTLDDLAIETERPVEVVAWTNEEGSRFAPAMIASGVFAGVFSIEHGLSRADATGTTIAVELDRIGYAGAVPAQPRPLAAYFEAHIEQGPILEAAGAPIGVVSGAQGQRWYELTLTGREAHAGTTPMDRRADALVGAARIVTEINRLGHETSDGVATVGVMRVGPNSRNTIPGSAFFTVDLRHPDETALSAMGAELREYAAGVAREDGLSLEIDEIWHAPPILFDQRCVSAVDRAAAKLGFAHMPVVSGAGHDACHIARIAPTGMIFVPCADGISHNEAESATPSDLAAGCDVLLHAVLELAGA
jgi:N-carbamoyl-L-amino-acid hydrolase